MFPAGKQNTQKGLENEFRNNRHPLSVRQCYCQCLPSVLRSLCGQAIKQIVWVRNEIQNYFVNEITFLHYIKNFGAVSKQHTFSLYVNYIQTIKEC